MIGFATADSPWKLLLVRTLLHLARRRRCPLRPSWAVSRWKGCVRRNERFWGSVPKTRQACLPRPRNHCLALSRDVKIAHSKSPKKFETLRPQFLCCSFSLEKAARIIIAKNCPPTIRKRALQFNFGPRLQMMAAAKSDSASCRDVFVSLYHTLNLLGTVFP